MNTYQQYPSTKVVLIMPFYHYDILGYISKPVHFQAMVLMGFQIYNTYYNKSHGKVHNFARQFFGSDRV